uniref:Uncharacterized protein n=1 Tax=Anopheles dirus TaxID=7168 RepID=A0A182NWU5_9DIPT
MSCVSVCVQNTFDC